MFFEGNPCKHGHGSKRYLSTKRCVVCQALATASHQQKNREKTRERWRRYYYNNPEYHKQRMAEWSKANAAKCRAKSARRRAATVSGTLPGYDQEIQAIYDSCPADCDVDHIVPLQGTNVCGLHVPWNLQHLNSSLNAAKKNSFIGE